MTRLDIQDFVPLSDYTSFRAGGPARYFVTVSNEEELKIAVDWADRHKQPIFVLAGGTNLIISSDGFAGLVINVLFQSLVIKGQQLTAGAATPMKELVDASIAAGLAGLEWAGGLPGSFGGAIRGNAGAFGGEIKDVVESVECFDVIRRKIITLANKDCQFDYRDSLFKQDSNLVILSATLQLQAGGKEKLRAEADDHIRYRQERHPMEYPNSGSIFKNVPLEKVPQKYLPLFAEAIKNDPFPLVPTAKIIAVAGLRGLRVGDAQISEKHTNYIVNLGKATGEDIVDLIQNVQKAVNKKYGIALEVEPELVGFSS